MEQLITDYPKATVVVGAFLIGILIKILFIPHKQLANAVVTLSTAVKDIQEEIKEGRMEAKTDREYDRRITGHILDRLQKQETKCETTHKFCPHITPTPHNRRASDLQENDLVAENW